MKRKPKSNWLLLEFKKYKNISILLLILIFSISIIQYYRNSDKPKIEEIIVDAAMVKRGDISHILEFAAITEAYQTVSVKSLVSGQLLSVEMQEGQTVKKGDLLFNIDYRNFQYQLEEAIANLSKDMINLENAEKEVIRYENLFKDKAISEEQYQQMVTNRDGIKAAIKADEANISNAKLQIEYSQIASPIDGKLGEILLDNGNIIQANNSTLTTINKISPIYVSFSVPEIYLSRIRKLNESNNLFLTIKSSSGNEINNGKIVFIDNNMDISSGTIKLKALLPNDDELLWPGQFVRVFLVIDNKKDAIIIPNKAIQNNQKGPYVFVINKDNKVEIRNISIEFSTSESSIVSSNLNAEEIIVINGQLKLVNGTIVKANL